MAITKKEILRRIINSAGECGFYCYSESCPLYDRCQGKYYPSINRLRDAGKEHKKWMMLEKWKGLK